ncbi:helix-turn-helix domain-containing protein [Salinicoccus kekensis]|uniref:Helix-turn-helix protein n=1 Tax=Salinicoccus kekensis TaxID=714307 RepID=A0A285UNS1_9STAP|nr:helix-turn-helix transcriptional regulator [Salinicoccus kekensis]SOC43479.1 helix-turn-helix protein [Salinicoccus kekensis]
MSEMNISQNILSHRKRIGFTQNELADFLSISKAAVSKWEKGHSIPDIGYLGELSVLFDISLDELVGFSPDLNKSQIRQIYNELAEAFSSEDFDVVLGRVRSYSKRYYNCYPFLSAMIKLLINHVNFTENKDPVLELAETYIGRVLEFSESLHLKEEMVFYQAVILIMKEQPGEASELLKDFNLPKLPVSSVLAQSYLLMDEPEKAKSTLQIQIYEGVIYMMIDLTMLLHSGLYDDLDGVIERGSGLDRTFNMKSLHPNSTLNFYLAAAMKHDHDKEKCLFYLREFQECVKNLFKEYYIHGDEFFSEVDEWIADIDTGRDAPVKIGLAKEQLIDVVENSAVFSAYKDDISFKNIVHNLKKYIGGEKNE